MHPTVGDQATSGTARFLGPMTHDSIKMGSVLFESEIGRCKAMNDIEYSAAVSVVVDGMLPVNSAIMYYNDIRKTILRLAGQSPPCKFLLATSKSARAGYRHIQSN